MQLYIHLPFCKSKCRYCDFNSYAGQSDALLFSYLTALNREISYAAKQFENARIKTVYIGGGTPSILKVQDIERICNNVLKAFDADNIEEFSIECNPESIEEYKLSAYKKAGINRISIGVQSLDNRNLRAVGRLHDADTAIDRIKLANKYFDNVSCDLIIGLPYDTLDVIRDEISVLAPLVQHISVYELTLEKGTELEKRVKEGKVILPSDDEVAQMFESATDILAKFGHIRYEISNFAKDGRFSKHNYGYWTREEYLGLGAGAHSLIKTADGKTPLANEIRFASPKDLNAYIAGVNCVDSFDKIPRTDLNVLTEKEVKNEEIMLGLRTSAGVNKRILDGRIPDELKRFFIEKHGNVRLTDEGMAVMNSILVRLLEF